MKAFNNLFNQVCSFDNIHLAYLKARKNKRYKKDILSFGYYLEYNLTEIRYSLENETYKHGIYKEFIVKDSKKRLIKAPTFKDRVVHHSLCNIIEPIFEKTFILDSYACRRGKGVHKAVKKLKSFLKRKGTIYCLKCDISKYFDSINHDILLSLIKKKIKDKRTIWLIEEILSSSFSKKEGAGIPIGNLTSQLFANIYLSRFDYFVQNTLKEKMYLRYMDDFLFLGEKHRLKVVAKKSGHFLFKELKLEMNRKKINIFPINKGIDFLGYVIFKHYILLRKKTVKRFLRKKKGKEACDSWLAYAKHADAYLLGKNLGLVK